MALYHASLARFLALAAEDVAPPDVSSAHPRWLVVRPDASHEWTLHHKNSFFHAYVSKARDVRIDCTTVIDLRVFQNIALLLRMSDAGTCINTLGDVTSFQNV